MTHGGIPNLRLFTLLDLSISSPLLILENFLHIKTWVILITGLVHNQKFTCSARTQAQPILCCISYSYWSLVEQRKPHKNSKRENEIKGRICQNWTVHKDEFFRGTSVAQIEKLWNNKSCVYIWGSRKKIHINTMDSKNLFMCRNPNLTSTSTRTLLGTTNAMK